MTEVRSIILEIVNEKFRTEPSNRNVIKLEEKNANKSYDFRIGNVPKDSIAIKVDDFKSQCSKFKHDANWKCVDYVIISESQKKILYIELKWGKSKDKGKDLRNYLIRKFKGSKYLIQKIEEERKTLILGKYQSRFIAIISISSRRYSRIDLREKKQCDKPEDFMQIIGGKPIRFNEIARCSSRFCCS